MVRLFPLVTGWLSRAGYGYRRLLPENRCGLLLDSTEIHSDDRNINSNKKTTAGTKCSAYRGLHQVLRREDVVLCIESLPAMARLTELLRDDHAEEALLAHVVPHLLRKVPVFGDLVVVQHLAQSLNLRMKSGIVSFCWCQPCNPRLAESTSYRQTIEILRPVIRELILCQILCPKRKIRL